MTLVGIWVELLVMVIQDAEILAFIRELAFTTIGFFQKLETQHPNINLLINLLKLATFYLMELQTETAY